MMWFKGVLVVFIVSVALFKWVASLNSSSFPADFLFGTASAAHQIEGATYEGGKSQSNWDNFTHKYPGKIFDHSNADIATDSYHRYKEDVGLMKDIGFQAYRFSVSWSRILPSGHLKDGVNQEGITYYNNLINELLSNGLQPFITLFHWELPQALEDEYGGFLSPKIVEDFADFAEVCFREFGDRVKHWITLNEPLPVSLQGYAHGMFPPARCSKWIRPDCEAGDSSTEPYIVSHYQLLAHAAVVNVYRDKFQSSQKGEIGIALSVPWIMPLSPSKADVDAVSRVLAFFDEWYMGPLYNGEYPAVMVEKLGDRLPKFSKRESAMIKGSFDFLGLNYYTATYVGDIPCQRENLTFLADFCALFSATRDGIPIGPQTATDWLYSYPQGILDLLEYTQEKYGDPIIYITENGINEPNDGTKALDDNFRIDFIVQHLSYIEKAIRNGIKVKGYFVWSLLDNFEWSYGYTVRWGIIHVDFKNDLKRYYKQSALWFKRFLHQ
ncbi:hypothetical protein S83_063459 [Arachis hypogaea]